MKGRKALPSAVRLMRGEKPRNPNEPKPDPTLPACPAHIVGDARKEWNRITALLSQAGIITSIDYAALALYCQTWARWIAAEKRLAKEGLVVEGDTMPHVNPVLKIINDCTAQLCRLLSELGMTPAARSKVSAIVSKPAGLQDKLKASRQTLSDDEEAA